MKTEGPVQRNQSHFSEEKEALWPFGQVFLPVTGFKRYIYLKLILYGFKMTKENLDLFFSKLSEININLSFYNAGDGT